MSKQQQRQKLTNSNSIIQSCHQYFFQFPNKVNINIHWSFASSNALIVVRVLAFLAITVRFSYQVKNYNSLFQIFQFLTEFGFILTWIYFTLVCLDFLINESRSKKLSPELAQWINILYQVVLCLQFPITIMFWSILFDYTQAYSFSDMILQIGVHGLPLFCLLIDLGLNIYQFPLRHLIIILIVGFFYLFVNLGYSLKISPIYSPIDWISLMSYVWVFACLLIVIAVHTLSHFIWKKCKKEKLQISNQPLRSVNLKLLD